MTKTAKAPAKATTKAPAKTDVKVDVKAPAKATTKADVKTSDALNVHGVTLAFGDADKGGTVKKPLVTLLDITSIKVVKGFNPRRNFSGVEELAASIKQDGLLSALVVRPAKSDGTFNLVSGERRLRAATLAGLTQVPVLVRTDLAADDLRAKALAVVENSEDMRCNLNPIELGYVFAEMEKQGWTVPQIAKEVRHNVALVRRCLTLLTAPADMQTAVAEGRMAMAPALELAKLDPATLAEIRTSLTAESSANEVRKLAKEAAKKLADPDTVHDGKGANKKKGAERTASLATWKSSREKNVMLASRCALLRDGLEADVQDDPEMLHGLRGLIAGLLWDRGDIAENILPPADSTEASEMKINKLFMSIVVKEAAKAPAPKTAGK